MKSGKSFKVVMTMLFVSVLSSGVWADTGSFHKKEGQQKAFKGSVLKSAHQKPQSSQLLQKKFLGPRFVSGGPATSAIECCTNWNSSVGTFGCASFPGNSCPDYAPFEAY